MKKDEITYDAGIFETLLKEYDGKDVSKNVLEDLEPEDITESVHLDMTDENIDKSRCSLIAYNVHVDETDDSEAYNPKKNPDKAVDIIFEYPGNDLVVEVFLNTKTKDWDSWINGKGKLSPEQMGQFFESDFYGKLNRRLHKIWPEKDLQFKELLNAIDNKKYCIDGFVGEENDEEVLDEETGTSQFGTGKADINRSKEKNAAGKQVRSRSGRKYIQPSDFAVKHDDNEAYFCWPSKGREFKFSAWSDWKKIKPLCRIRFAMGTANPHVYGLSMRPLAKPDENRGFIGYDLTAQPPLQYITPEETHMMMDLTIVKKFLKNAIKRITKYLNVPDEEIFKRVNKPEKCTIEDIRKTKRAIKNGLEALRKQRADTYIYT